jgi:uncharacterized protein DUF6496
MDPLRVVLRAVFAYVYLLLAVRASGKRLVARQNTVEFVLALAFADLIDDAVLGDVPASQGRVGNDVRCAPADVRSSTNYFDVGGRMATTRRRYSKKASTSVESAMRRRKRGTLRSGSGRKVRSRKQAIAIGLSEARKKGARVPKRSRSSAR